MPDKTPERQALETEIAEIMSSISVRFHYTASAGAKIRRYAVFQSVNSYLASAVQLTEPASHAEAQRQCREIVAERILDRVLATAVPA